MSESDSNLSYSDYLKGAGDTLGYGHTNAKWSSDTAKADRVATAVANGEHLFYFTLPMIFNHRWSFFKPEVDSITLEAGVWEYDMDDDCLDVEGPIYFDTNQGYKELEIVNQGEIIRRRQYTTSNGTPIIACVRFKTHTQTTGPRKVILIHPPADADDTLFFIKVPYPRKMSTTYTYTFAGAEHARTVLACVNAAAEELRFNKPGPLMERAEKLVGLSVQIDKRHGQEHFGYNADRSSYGPTLRRVRNHSIVQYGGHDPSDYPL